MSKEHEITWYVSGEVASSYRAAAEIVGTAPQFAGEIRPEGDCYRVTVEYLPEEKQYYWWFNGKKRDGWANSGPDAVYHAQKVPYANGYFYEETFRVYATLSTREQKLKELRRAIRIANGEAVTTEEER